MAKRKFRLGVLVPSSNTAAEPLTTAIVASVNDPDLQITVHYARLRVTTLSLDATSNAQFDPQTMLDAASLLADAKVDVIGWSGTSAGWLGFDRDQKLCAAIKNTFGIPATTSTMALIELLQKSNVSELGLVTPYAEDMNQAIMKNFKSIGINIDPSREKHLDISPQGNDAIVKIGESTIENPIREVASTGVKFITTYCTNLRAAHMVESWEEKYDVVIVDSVAVVVLGMLNRVGLSPSIVKGWGKMFDVA